MGTRFSFLVLFLFLVHACTDYADGPRLTMRTPKKRLVGTYTLTEFTSNSINLTDSILKNPDYAFRLEIWRIRREEFYRFRLKKVDSDTVIGVSYGIGAGEAFYSDREGAFLRFSPSLNYNISKYACFTEELMSWTVDRLSMEDLWLSVTLRDTTYTVKFKEE